MIPLPHKVTIHKKGEKDRWGIITHQDPKEYDCFVQYSSDKVVTPEGAEIKIDLNITFKGNVEIDYGDKVEFKDIFKSPKSIEKLFDLAGVILYTKVLV